MRMRKTILVGAVLLVVVLAAAYWRWVRGHQPARETTSQSAQDGATDEATDDYAGYTPMPRISLIVNGRSEPVLAQGTPLLLSVRVANTPAMNAELINRSRSLRLQVLTQKVAAGILKQTDLDARKPQLTRTVPIKTVELGTAGWSSLVRFVIRQADGASEPLPWPLKGIGERDEQQPLVLDGIKTDELDYGVDPQAARAIAPGRYQLVAVLEQGPDRAHPARWHGTVESEPVPLTIVATPASPTAAQKVEGELHFVRYFVATNEAEEARRHAQTAVDAKPDDIGAHIALGDALAMKKETLQEALAEYNTALDEFDKQYPDSYESPQYLILKTSKLLAKLRAQDH